MSPLPSILTALRTALTRTGAGAGKTLKNVRPRLISESLFNKVQKMIEKNQKNKGDNKRLHDSLFGQKMICGCGTRYVTHHMCAPQMTKK